MQFANKKEQVAFMVGIGIAVAIVLFAVMAKQNGDSPSKNSPYENTLEKKRILSQMRIDLLKSVEMEKNAVMALTDQESIDFANQSRAASATVGQNLNILRSLVDAIPSPDEQKLMNEFTTCWAEFGKLDQVILELAVENTNLKAAALSRGKGAETMQKFEQALEYILQSSPGMQDESRIAGPVSRALIAGLKIYNLHSTHIAEAIDEKMDQIEAQMKTEENNVADSLAVLSDLVGAESLEAVSQAKTAFAEFAAVTAEVMQLSRKNSNVKSMELSFGKKRRIAAQCDTVLAAFQETAHNKTYKATK
ncbi:MCP four helix bundle domain-containing protein [uncultured Desulfobulbus sp.]|uniref:MCP four helix bundle domain-containing protein n=1 Tax=uncultured Desulfobulbus sp. TaxID=239745 RepID=UPI0029C6C90F|nr:MCP four helix bundle domain-containing protein [uncultured Desulfobulbus sp.]